MDLKEFIAETLSQIIDGIVVVQKKYDGQNVLVCPDDIQGNKGEYYIEDESVYTYHNRKNRVQEIDMDIAISVSEKDGNKAGIGIAQILKAGISTENVLQNENISKIKFSIPIVLPSSDTRKFFEKQSQ